MSEQAKIEAAKKILQVRTCDGIVCSRCPAYRGVCPGRRAMLEKPKLGWFEAYLTEHDKPKPVEPGVCTCGGVPDLTDTCKKCLNDFRAWQESKRVGGE